MAETLTGLEIVVVLSFALAVALTIVMLIMVLISTDAHRLLRPFSAFFYRVFYLRFYESRNAKLRKIERIEVPEELWGKILDMKPPISPSQENPADA